MTDNVKNQQQNIFTNIFTSEKDIIEVMYKEFIANIVLSIKTPCIGIWSQSLILSCVEDDPNKKSSICDIANCAKELIEYSDDIIAFTCEITNSVKELIEHSDDIMAFAKSHLNMPPIMSKEFDFRKLVNRVITTLKPLSDHQELRLVKNTHPETPKFIIGDSYRIEAILHHLITNAIKFAKEDSFCGVTSQLFLPRATELNKSDNAAMLQIIVHDTGIGMSEETRQYLYQQLNSLDSDLSTHKEGAEEDADTHAKSSVKLSFGLNLVKKFIRELQGKIELSSKEGENTTFTLKIPVKVQSSV